MATSIFDDGIVVDGCRAVPAFRILVNMSAIGSVTTDIDYFPTSHATALIAVLTNRVLPTRLGDTWQLTGRGEFPETDPAQTKLANIGTRSTTQLATVVVACAELGWPAGLDNQRFLRHLASFSGVSCDLEL